jgi:type I restriction enzyme S subunit
MIPEEWKIVQLSELIDSLETGVSVNSYDHQASIGEVGVLKTSALNECKFNPYENKKIKEDESHRVKTIPKKGQIIISRMNTPALVGLNAYVDKDYPNLFLPDRLWQTVFKKDCKISTKWLSYFLSYDVTLKKISSLATGTSDTMKNISKDEFLSLEILMPVFSEQTKIAEILSTCDEAIDKIQKLVHAKEKQKKGLMQNLLTGKVRFKNYTSTNWTYTKLGELSFIRRGASPRPISDPKFFSTEGRGWIRISDVSSEQGRYLNKTTQYLSVEGENNSVKVDRGDLIMSICATIGLPKIINIPSCIHDGFVLIKPIDGKLHTYFLYHYINFITDKLADSGQPGTQKNLNTDIVSRIEVPSISFNEQSEIANVLDQVENEILILNKELKQLKTQKKGLMQQLLTGKIRVK